MFEDGPWCDGEPEQSPIFSDAFEHSLWCEDNSDEDHGHVAYEFGSDVDSSGDTESGLRAAQLSSPSLSFEVERELRKEAMMIKTESSSPNSNHASYFTDSHSNSDKEGEEEEEEDDSVTTVAHTASQASPPDGVSNDIALQLATQLYAFQGCTKEQHEEQDRQHQQHHQRGDVDSHCASLADILPIIQGRGVDRTMPPLPDVLSQPGIMKAQELPTESCASAFEGAALLTSGLLEEDVGSQALKNLCLSVHHTQSRIAPSSEVTYDIDSICGVANSLAVARLGIQWLPKSFPVLNIVKDLHLVLRASYTTRNGRVASRYTPLHKIPHYCFGQLEGMESVKVYIFFPNLRSKIDYDYTSFLTRKEDEDWLDLILAPCLQEVIKSPSILQHFPLSSAAVRAASLASSQETFSLKSSSREQIIPRTIHAEHLDSLWSAILRRIENTPGCHHFSNATIFLDAKNTKLSRMMDSPPEIYAHWQERWNYVTDARFYERQRIYVDLGKQTTAQSLIGSEAEVFLNRSCCANTYFQRRAQRNKEVSNKTRALKHTVYQWAGLRDVVDHNIAPAPSRSENIGEHAYTQFYNLIKTPGDAAGVYPFQNQALENLALDPEYVKSLKREGSATSFSTAICMDSYLHSKERAHISFTKNRRRSYGCREEHRITMSVMDKICQHWCLWEQDSNLAPSRDRPLPYYIVPSSDLFDFLHSQVNKYCFLFEHILAHATKTRSLSETAIMIVALRALRVCYGSTLTSLQPVLFKDRWEQKKGAVNPTLREGLGMEETMKRCGIAWFLPKINWAVARFMPLHQANLVQSSMLLHQQYKRRWRAVRDLRSAFVRLSQADGWYDQYHLAQNQSLRNMWLDYLHVLNIEQFDSDIWKTVLKMNMSRPELAPGIVDRLPDIQFCFQDMQEMCELEGQICPPHVVTGNKSRFKNGFDLLHFLFSWKDGSERIGWDAEPYRMIFQKTLTLIRQHLGQKVARQWSDQFFHLLQLTHWVLPYPGPHSMMQHTKSRLNSGVQARMMWFSAIYQPGKPPPHWPEDQPYNLPKIVETSNLTAFGDTLYGDQWEIQQLISIYSAKGLAAADCIKGWVLGRQSYSSTRSSKSYWEEFHRPPRLKLLEKIKGKSLDELDDLMLQFQQDIRDEDGDTRQTSINTVEAESQERHNSDAVSIFSDATSGSVWEP